MIAPGHTFASVTDKISSIVLTQRTPIGRPGVAECRGLADPAAHVVVLPRGEGVGIWGINIPVGWAFDITTSSGGSVSATPAR
ncbi:MAG: hypothetical protein QM736_03150 [Vicinamibacterales bacterium]